MIVKLPESIKKQCHDFILNYKKNEISLLKKLNHNKK